MDTNPRMQTGIYATLYAYGDFSVTRRVHTGNVPIWEIKSCIPICVISHTGIAVCTWGSLYANGWGPLKSSHMGIPLCIMKLCAYGDKQLNHYKDSDGNKKLPPRRIPTVGIVRKVPSTPYTTNPQTSPPWWCRLPLLRRGNFGYARSNAGNFFRRGWPRTHTLGLI